MKYFFIFLLTIVFSSFSDAHGGATGVVKQRMDAMVSLKKAMKSLHLMIVKDQDYDAQSVAKLSAIIADHAGASMLNLFPAGSNHSPSEVKIELWDEWEAFTNMANELESLAKSLNNVASSDSKAVRHLFKALKGNCSDCHD